MSQHAILPRTVPFTVYVLASGVFAMVTSEFAVAGLMPQLAASLGTGIEQIGYLVTIFALAMALGGPLLILAFRALPPRTGLIIAYSVFLAGNVLAALAPDYAVMVVARVVTGMAGQAVFGLTVSLCVQLVDERVRGRAVGVAMNGLMLGTLLGLPLATFIGGQFGWRWAFGAISLMVAIALALVVRFVRNPPDEATAPPTTLAEDAAVLRWPPLLLALVSSTLIIGATFSVFSFLAPILTQVTGFAEATVPLILLAYGAATVLGNWIVSRLADRHTALTLLLGTGLNVAFLAGLALFASTPIPAIATLLGVGLVGVTMNPAMAIRVQRAGSTAPLINTVHASFITFGIVVSSWLGAALIPHYGLRAPIIVGAVMAVLAALTILPALRDPRLRATAASAD